MNPDKPTQGSLEELFRHHLLESEQAAVPPSPRAWEQVDNSLLLAQNAKYRRRLSTYRMAMAASLLLALLVSVGWWRHRAGELPAVAEARSVGGGQAVSTTRSATGAAGRGDTYAAARPGTAGTPTATATSAAMPHPKAARLLTSDQRQPTKAGLLAGQRPRVASPAAAHSLRSLVGTTAGRAELAGGRGSGSVASAALGAAEPATAEPSAVAAQVQQGATIGAVSAAPTAALPGPANGLRGGNGVALASGGAATALDALASRVAKLPPGAASALPAGVAVGTVPPSGTPQAGRPARAWQFGAAYAASAFNPNVNFERNAASYNRALGPNSADATYAAAAEYRDHLRAGLGQRLSLRATRRLGSGGRVALSTGLEVTQSRATSASSVAFVGEQVPDGFTAGVPSQAPRPLQTTSYRYRTAGVPVEVRYAQPVKNGFSLYGRVGAVVSALLGVRTEVEGTPEATRTYSIGSAGTPYRRVTASLRGGAGVQYRPAGSTWAFNLGPVAEAGLLTLNAEPAQDYGQQSRPYSVGLEAGVEFGRAPKAQ